MIELPDLFSYILSPPFQRTILAMKILFIASSVCFLISIMYSILKTHYIQWRFGEDLMEAFAKRPYYGVKKVSNVWAGIAAKMETGLASDYKLAIIEADGILDDIFGKIGYKGKTLGERLEKLSPDHFPDLDKLLEAHQVRDDIVRDPDYQLSLEEAKKVLAVYKESLKELGVF